MAAQAFLKLPQRVYLGENLIRKIGDFLATKKNKGVMVFTDPGLVKAGLVKPLEDYLINSEISYKIETDLKPEPSYTEVDNLLERVSKFECDTIIAIGGGSVMDAAKLVSLLKGTNKSVKDLIDDASTATKKCSTIFIPTTAGTGSEATINAIVLIPEKQVKFGIVSDAMLPDLVLLDVDNVKNLPKPILASSAMDALSHCVECYTAKNATVMSDGIASMGAKLIFRNIVKAYQNPEDIEAREALQLGAFYGGVAITASGTNIVHALSYPLGGKFHIAHGVSNAILFKAGMEMNKEAIKDRLASLCDIVWPEEGSKSVEEKADFVIDKISEIVKEVEIPTDLKKFGVKDSDLDFLVDSALEQKRLLSHNMKNLTREDVVRVYKSVMEN
ncbi:iron-containing alcohol dehydrogenase [Lactobacillus crispatus]|uniref:Iron-containing alcohol dehydrogenase n=1 Tax=Lactobacillus crispatus TaxID=47770 RepID=A0A7H9E839_9LACO|nr:iron-containing alcohol dehydrogenase [Lactobacillus crispatus]QLL73527.1 iron-containing alcohol dehydrogenase [Lactobacillus crispatus]